MISSHLLCLTLLGILVGWTVAWNVEANTPASPNDYSLTLSDQRVLSVSSAGNEQDQWLETASGQALVRRNGLWYFAELHEGRAFSTGIAVAEGGADVAPEYGEGVQQLNFSNLSYPYHQQDNPQGPEAGNLVSFSPSAVHQVSFADGDVDQPVLLIRVSFSDRSFQYSRSSFSELMFSGSRSVSRYFQDNSYQHYYIRPAIEAQGVLNDGIVDVTLAYDHPNFGGSYGSASQKMVADALRQASDSVNFDAYDINSDHRLSVDELAIVFIVAGYENAYGGAGAPEPRVWAHKSDVYGLSLDGVSMTSYALFGEIHQNHIATIGIMCHELGHLLFGLPDLYDRQGDSNGIGRWGLMGLGSWNASSGYSGSSPAHMLAWSKAKAGFMTPENISGDRTNFSLASTTTSAQALRVWLDPFQHGEHFLLEYRSQHNFDRGLPGEGLLISHVDDWVGFGSSGAQNDVAAHKLVDIEEADGRLDLDTMANRGDYLDVYNDRTGLVYFGSGSIPASLDYQGQASGVEVSDIDVSTHVTADISLPYDSLGNNLGYDDGGSMVSWGINQAQAASLVRLELPASMPWAHGVDVYSHADSVVSVSLFSSFSTGLASNSIWLSPEHHLTQGWNRLKGGH